MCFQPMLKSIPIDAFVWGVRIRRGILVVQNPVVCDKTSIKRAHQRLTYVVHAVLIMPFVHLGYDSSLLQDILIVVTMVVLPDIMKAMQLVLPNCCGNITILDSIRKSSCRCQIVPGLDKIGSGDREYSSIKE